MLISLPYYDAMDTLGAAPGGAENGGGSVDTGASAPVKMTADTMFDPGDGTPVKWGDYSKRYVDKAEFTRTTQGYAAREKQYRDQIAAAQREAQSARQPVSPQGPTEFERDMAALQDAPYVNGKQAAAIVNKLVQNGIAPLANGLKQRDEVIKLLYQKLQGMDQTVSGLRGKATDGEIQSVLSGARDSAKLPNKPVIDEFLKDVYYSHEGADLHKEFGTMVRQRWTDLVAAVREWDREQATAARAAGAGLPGRGGGATPGKPLKRGFESPEDIAKAWFPSFRDGDAT